MMYRMSEAIFLHCFLCSLMGVFIPTNSTDTDVYCLKSIKDSLEDPFGYLQSSWDFNNNTEGFICRFTGVDCWHPDENKVLNLRLSDMGLKGQFPLRVQYCKRITGLDLSNNELQGPIPANMAHLIPFVTSLDLSSNIFSGEIPQTQSIANLRYLNSLKLDHNQLTGQIPLRMTFLDRLNTFTVAHNNLSGPVPVFIGHFNSDSFVNNPRLCGKPLEVCKYPRRKYEYSFENGFTIGYVVSVAVVITVYGSYCVPWIHDRKRNKMITVAAVIMLMLKKMLKKKAEVDLLQSLSTLEFLLETQVSTSENFVTRMSYKDLRNATDNFSQNNIMGFGEMGTMYKATLPNGWSLAVKKFPNSQQSEEHFITELKILGKLRHANLLPLLGFCKESKKRCLVYKYVSKGNLFDSLHSTECKKKILNWPLRMRIATGLARGLSWLHHCCEFRVAHLNICSKSILLDQNFEPKLSNFGMATLVNPKEISGSRGFCIDIEFWEECFIKEDVYNFGIVLLELITGRNAIALNNNSDEMLDNSISINDLSSLKISDLNYVIDELLIGHGYDYEIFKCLKIACNCVNSLPEERPTMLDVYTTLSIIRNKYEE